MKKKSQKEIIFEYFKKHPLKDISHPEVVDWATKMCKKRTGKICRDPDRAIRRLHQDGFLIKKGKGIYRYDPKAVLDKKLEDFTPKMKKVIFERDGFKCVICGKGIKEGMEIHADHIKPKDLGGEATIENGQTLCSQHNFKKKNLKQTETGKKMFIRLYDLCKKDKDKEVMEFCADILETFEKHDINGHIEWER